MISAEWITGACSAFDSALSEVLQLYVMGMMSIMEIPALDKDLEDIRK